LITVQRVERVRGFPILIERGELSNDSSAQDA
jgi:hypothetical protein